MAGVSTKEIKSRIRSMTSTKQITKAMEMVAASKMTKTQAQIANSRPYFETLYRTMCAISRSNREVISPYQGREQIRRTLYVVIAGDRGLAGGYNTNLLKAVSRDMEGKEAEILPIGKKAVEYFSDKNLPLVSVKYTLAEDVNVGDCFTIAKDLAERYLSGEYDGIRFAYTRFHSVLSQEPSLLTLLPLENMDFQETEVSSREVAYEPDGETLFNAIVPEYLGGVMYGALCESRASEQAARRTAMEAATGNAEDMIADLSLQYNRARQAAITQEITEIIAGA